MTLSRQSAFATLGALMLLGTLFTGCTKYDSYDGESFDCDCGYLVWDGRDLGMRMAEVEQLDSETYRYHIVADVRTLAEIESRDEPRDVVFTLTTALNGANTTLNLEAGDEALTVQQVESPGLGVDWTMSGASLSIAVGADVHVMTMTNVSATRGNNTIDVTGEITFDLVD
ncbi:MAG: hypothetical protein VXZ28_02120 [Bacteroidota bacterium]|nr:hypothetical protein [Bacteroidota bacterium]MEC8361814.1 hypothetical protein [Bacteroidota bacterium]MEC8400107.1 hypothetical protein [Bacteroidota bacterium]